MFMDMRSGPAPLPREHGGWAMLVTPPAIALVAAGPDFLGIMAALGWFLAYCVRGPVEVLRGAGASGRAGMARSSPEVARFWVLIFAGLSVTLLGPVIIFRPWAFVLLAIAGATLVVVQVLADRGLARTVTAGMLAVTGLMAGGPLYYLAKAGTVSGEGWVLALACWAFFAGSILRVKTLARERRSSGFRSVSVALHVGALLLGVWAALSGWASWLLPLALTAPAAWALFGALRAGEAVSLMIIGKGEQRLTILFGVLMIIALI